MITTWNKQVNHESSQPSQLEIQCPPLCLDGKDYYTCPISVLSLPLGITFAVNEAFSSRILFPFIMSKGSNLYTSPLNFSLTSGYKIKKLFFMGFFCVGTCSSFVDVSFGNLWGLSFIPVWYFQLLKEYAEMHRSHIHQDSCEVLGGTTNLKFILSALDKLAAC